jgi:sporulation protein YlmC with PRC-barrel domain
MPDELAENLSGKEVMTSSGTYIGVLRNIQMNTKTGTIADLLVSPFDDVSPDQHRFETVTDEGESVFSIPVSNVRDVDDAVVVK